MSRSVWGAGGEFQCPRCHGTTLVCVMVASHVLFLGGPCIHWPEMHSLVVLLHALVPLPHGPMLSPPQVPPQLKLWPHVGSICQGLGSVGCDRWPVLCGAGVFPFVGGVCA